MHPPRYSPLMREIGHVVFDPLDVRSEIEEGGEGAERVGPGRRARAGARGRLGSRSAEGWVATWSTCRRRRTVESVDLFLSLRVLVFDPPALARLLAGSSTSPALGGTSSRGVQRGWIATTHSERERDALLRPAPPTTRAPRARRRAPNLVQLAAQLPHLGACAALVRRLVLVCVSEVDEARHGYRMGRSDRLVGDERRGGERGQREGGTL
ncbi:hypothetical protein DMC30DRAFT_402728, partial [Rhodotorula diobovata]